MDAIELKEPKVTVYMNTRNRAGLIGRALDSLRDQTFTDFEVLVLDAGSTDSTKEVVEKYSKSDDRIKYIGFGNEKLATCLNYVISKANGKYITQLDDDDEYLPEKICRQVQLLDSSPENVAVVYCWEEFWDDKKNEILYLNTPSIRGDAYLKLLEKSCVGGGTTMMMRKSAFDFVGGLDESIQLGADYQLNINLSKYFHHDFVPEVLVRTHVNHQYGRLSDMKIAIMQHGDIIEMLEKILTDHSETFNDYPNLKFGHYRSIMHSAAKIRNYKIFVLYLGKGLSIKNPFSIKVLFFLRGMFHLLFAKR